MAAMGLVEKTLKVFKETVGGLQVNLIVFVAHKGKKGTMHYST